jgi:hypothetical protein
MRLRQCLMLRRPAFALGCVMQHMGGIPSGGRSTCPTPRRVSGVALSAAPMAGAGDSAGVTEARPR